MTPEQYRTHKSGALRRAFWRGVDAARAGLPLEGNPYWTVGAQVKARRGSWSEAYATAWGVGWQSEQPASAARAQDVFDAVTSGLKTRAGRAALGVPEVIS